MSWFNVGIPEGHTLFNNAVTGTQFVVVFIGLVNTSSQANDSMLVRLGPNGAAVHSGSVGSGSFDRFPLVCNIAITVGQLLTAVSVFGTWDTVVSGYYTPLIASD